MVLAILHSSLALTLAVCATFVPRLRRPHTPNPDHEPIHRPFRSHRCPTRPRRAAQRRRHAHPRRRLLRPPAERPGAGDAAVDLSHAENRIRPEFHAGRPDHADVPMHRLAAATLDRPVHRPSPAAVFAAAGDVLLDGRRVYAGAGEQLPDTADCGGTDRRRFVDLPPGSVARGAPRLGRTLWLRAVAVPGR